MTLSIETDAPEWLFLRSGEATECSLKDCLEAVLPHCNWRTHIVYLCDGGMAGQWVKEQLVPAVVGHLTAHRFAVVALHPVLRTTAEHDKEGSLWKDVLEPARAFQVEAFRELGEPRYVVLPAVVPEVGVAADATVETVRWLRSHLAMPSVVTRCDMPGELVQDVRRAGIAVHIAPADVTENHGMLRYLKAHHVTDSLVDRVGQGDREPLSPCVRHLVIDGESGGVFGCLKAWQLGTPRLGVSDLADPPIAVPEALRERCSTCITETVLDIPQSFAASGQEEHCRQLCLRVGLALSERGDQHTAADCAHVGFDLARQDQERTVALLHEVKFCLDCEQVDRAEHILQLVRKHGAGDQLPLGDLHLRVAEGFIRLGEHSRARDHLDQAEAAGSESSRDFLIGLCELEMGNLDVAMTHLDSAVEGGPTADDVPRIQLYRATCLKELGRCDDAIDVLQGLIAEDPADYSSHNLLGFCLFKTSRHDEAVAAFREAIRFRPGSAIDWANLGINLKHLGHVEEAREALRKALSLDPAIDFAHEALQALS